VEPRSDAFIGDYFTPREQALVAHSTPHDRHALATLLWSAKESALKSLQEGLRLDTRSVEVDPGDLYCAGSSHSGDSAWRPLQVRYSTTLFYGWWRFEDRFVRTIVSASPMVCPRSLSPSQTAPICN
jgi:phosphopantetheinyl transferase